MKTQRTDHCCILKIPFFPWQMGKGEKLGGICKWFFIFVVCPPYPDLKTIISSINEEILYGALFVRQKAYFISVTNKHSHVTLQIQFKKKKTIIALWLLLKHFSLKLIIWNQTFKYPYSLLIIALYRRRN